MPISPALDELTAVPLSFQFGPAVSFGSLEQAGRAEQCIHASRLRSRTTPPGRRQVDDGRQIDIGPIVFIPGPRSRCRERAVAAPIYEKAKDAETAHVCGS
ncbi:hypothetical protein BDK51DRAFT_36936 [Blyttiomyces helicus]|uniref:Uncharacterized protein n=1 Tax=Blyttiomyces helicus TaxID=388810 RepID=A0A4V1IPU1_9FUNG|nr:hypothetical protein BDK51DRAFT_36936 [Blyttiomyces helicus]|eukprot:RKO84237.1 hypothetical protein BDK51DRAFT_36936 [Blyttiomyces helicus]